MNGEVDWGGNELAHLTNEIEEKEAEKNRVDAAVRVFKLGAGERYSQYQRLRQNSDDLENHLERLKKRRDKITASIFLIDTRQDSSETEVVVEISSSAQETQQLVPPRILEWLVGVLAPKAEREAIVGDCSEKFEDDVACRDVGYARRQYAIQAFRMLGPWLMKFFAWIASVTLEAFIRSRF